MHDPDNRMDFAARLCAEAGEITLRHFGRVATRFKADGSELTDADEAAEAHIRLVIAENFPDDGIVGEEGEDVASRSGRRWIVDPIDGTRSFSAGVPLYAVLIALEEEGRPVMGCCHLPALGETLVAARGAGAWHNGSRASVSVCDDLGSARLLTSGLEYWRDRATDPMRGGFDRLVRATRFTRTWGDAYGYFLIAVGRMDLLADPICGAYWDYAPILPILEEAGGRLTTLTGDGLAPGSSALASNGKLHGAAERFWRG
ncbi:MAG: hypothetical protein M3483_05240 [Gemmatimonadota bacterium]|nr:hypothetical protein [Gemmatimonadota bacterium]MDQ3605357.1 hypothetical protein [Gemmatimonadota bacterium]